MLDSRTRTFLHLVIRLGTSRQKRKKKPMRWVMRKVVSDILKEHAAEAIVQRRGERQRMDLRDFQEDNDGIILLFSFSDIRLPDPKLQDQSTGDIEGVEKELGKAWAYSAHLAIGYEKLPDGRYPALLEQVPHVSRTAIQNLLNRHLRDHPYQLGDGEEVRPRFEIDGEKSDELSRALGDDRLTGVELIHTGPKRGLGMDETGMVETRETLKYAVPRGKAREIFQRKDPMGVLRRFFGKAKEEDYDEMRVLLNKGDDSTIPDHVDIKTTAEEIEAALFVRRTRKKFANAMDNAHESVDDGIAEHVLSLIREKVPKAAQ